MCKPETPSIGRSTTVYHASVDLRGQRYETRSAGLPLDELREYLADPRSNAELIAKLEAALSLGHHNWSHLILGLTESFVSQCEIHASSM